MAWHMTQLFRHTKSTLALALSNRRVERRIPFIWARSNGGVMRWGVWGWVWNVWTVHFAKPLLSGWWQMHASRSGHGVILFAAHSVNWLLLCLLCSWIPTFIPTRLRFAESSIDIRRIVSLMLQSAGLPFTPWRGWKQKIRAAMATS